MAGRKSAVKIASAKSDVERVSDSILRTLTQDASRRRKETLGRLKDACENIPGQVTFAAIERYVADVYGKAFGPRAQSISNEAKTHLGMYHYVEAFNRERSVAGRAAGNKSRQAVQRTLAERIEAIPDTDLVIDLRYVLDRLLVAERQISRAKTLFKTLRVGVDFDAMVDGTLPAPVGNGAPSGIPEAQIKALQEFIAILKDDSTLRRCGLSNADGRIARRGGTGDELIPPDLLAGVFALCDALQGRAPRAIGVAGEKPDAPRS